MLKTNQNKNLQKIILAFVKETQENSIFYSKSYEYEKRLANSLDEICENVKSNLVSTSNIVEVFLELEILLEETKREIKKEYFNIGFVTGKAEIEEYEKK